jgi:hypothetical protein
VDCAGALGPAALLSYRTACGMYTTDRTTHRAQRLPLSQGTQHTSEHAARNAGPLAGPPSVLNDTRQSPHRDSPAHGPPAACAPAKPGAARDQSRRRAQDRSPGPRYSITRAVPRHRTTLNAGPPHRPPLFLYPFTLHSGRGPDDTRSRWCEILPSTTLSPPLALKPKVSLRKVDEPFRHVGRRKAQSAA